MTMTLTSEYAPLERMTKDLALSAQLMDRDEARFLVGAYYDMQDNRIRAAAQVRQLSKTEQPHAVLSYLFDQSELLEKQIARGLGKYADSKPLGRWAQAICGIGPVLSAGLLAHIDLEKTHCAASVWRFAGLDPSSTWSKGEKRPWNAELKVLCWKISESFVKVSSNPKDFYGQVYQARKAMESEKNERLEYADQAAIGAARVGKTTDAYKSYSVGKLPAGHLHARAERYAVKLFLSHYFEVGFLLEDKVPPRPYVLEHGGHVHKIEPPFLNSLNLFL